jgi:hypothetical protein
MGRGLALFTVTFHATRGAVPALGSAHCFCSCLFRAMWTPLPAFEMPHFASPPVIGAWAITKIRLDGGQLCTSHPERAWK